MSKMDPESTNRLLDSLEKQVTLVSPDHTLFRKILRETEPSRDALTVLSGETQLIQDSEAYHYLSLRRLIPNSPRAPSAWRFFYNELKTNFSNFSSDSLCDAMLADGLIASLTQASPSKYSLLAKLKSFRYDNPDQKLYITTRPLLIVPGAERNPYINAWQDEHTLYQKESGFLSGRKRISEREYLTV